MNGASNTSAIGSAARDLRLLAGAAFLSASGDMLALVTLALAVHDITGSGMAVAAYFGSILVPVVVLASLAGWLADRFDGRRVLGLASLAQGVVALGLVAGAQSLAAILALSALLSAFSAIAQPAEFALVPRLVGARSLIRANGLMESARYAGFAFGPVVAGVLAAVGDGRLAMVVNAASFLAIAATARAIRPQAAEHGAGMSERARDGVVLLWRDPVLRATVLAAAGALLFISASLTVEVFYVKEVLEAGDTAYALLTTVWMAGMVAGAAGLAPRIAGRGDLARVALFALAVQGAGMASQTLWLALPSAFAGYVVGGVGHGVKNTLLRTLIQERVPVRAHGRAFAAYNATRNAAELVATACGGLLVAAVGPRAALLVAGLGPVLAALLGLTALARPRALRGPQPLVT